MSLKIKVLQASHGDAVIVETCVNDDSFRILIDGGPPECFQRVQGWKVIPGPLRQALDELAGNEERFDLTILTHVDDDHIGGLLAACRHEKYRPIIAQDVWFNSGRLISQAIGEGSAPIDSDIIIKNSSDRMTSISQGVSFDDLLNEHCSVPRKVIMAGAKIPFKHGKITILSPTEDQLRCLLKKWEKEKPDSLTSASQTDYHFTMEELRVNDTFTEDSSVHNASSIAILIEVGGTKAVFLGDALPSVVCHTLRHKLGVSEERPLKVAVCKLSHHGSKANTNDELLSLIQSEKFIVSTNGLRHGLPNKATLARIEKKAPQSEVFFNYPTARERVFPNKVEREYAVNMKDLEGDLIL